MNIPAGTKLLMIGDSITDCDRPRPVGEGKGDALGNGYVSHINALINAAYPTRNIRIVNMGVAGDTVRELKARWRTDVLDQAPDMLSVMIGINDILRHFNRRLMTERHVPLDEYERTLEELTVSARAAGIDRIVLMTPFFVEGLKADPIREMAGQYGQAVRRISERQKTGFVDTQAAMDEYLAHHHSMEIAADRVHPTQTGHMIIARAWLRAIGYRWEGG